MNTMFLNLNNVLETLPEIIHFQEFNGYIKIDTACPISYCDECLTLYAKPVENGILITDLNGTFEDAYLNGISAEKLKASANSNGLEFDGVSVFAITTLENIGQIIKQFFTLINQLEL